MEGQRRAARAYRRAYLLGCVRKYFALLSHPGAPLISSLRNLAALPAEVAEAPASPAYWQHLARQVEETTNAGATSPALHRQLVTQTLRCQIQPQPPKNRKKRDDDDPAP